MSNNIYDNLYFQNRKFESKHYYEAMQWIDYFKLDENSTVLDFGCGLGFYGHALRYLGIDNVWGYEISEYACNNGYELMKGRIKNKFEFSQKDFILCYDVLEHITEEEIYGILVNIYNILKKDGYILFSICMKGDNNLEKDKTHLTKKTRVWWEYYISKYFEIISIPSYFWFSNQLIIGKKNA